MSMMAVPKDINTVTESKLTPPDKSNESLSESLHSDSDSDVSEEQTHRPNFFIEQIRLLFKKTKGRRYSPGLLAMAMMWQMTSPALYRQMLEEKTLCLPSVGHLKKLSKAFNLPNIFLLFLQLTIIYSFVLTDFNKV